MLQQKAIIYFDIDKTLIDTAKLFQIITDDLISKGVASDELRDTIEQYYLDIADNTKFNPNELIKRITKISSLKTPALKRIFFKKKHFSEALFPEVKECLNRLSKSYTIGVFSQGTKDWQMAKLQLSGIDRYVDPKLVIISPDKASGDVVATLKQEATVVDDKLAIIRTLANWRKDLKLFWLDRYHTETSPSKKYTTISRISQLEEMLASE